MKKVKFGKTDINISVMALGTMLFGSVVDKDTCFDIIDVYLARGGNFIDSANKYASWLPECKGGEAETVLREYMKSRRNRGKIIISSKVGFAYGKIPRSLKKEIIISECERSLKRLNIDTIDVYFAHAYDANTPIEESMEAFYQLKKDGKIRYAGASNFHSWRLERGNNYAKQNGWEGFVVLQQKHSYVKPILGADFGTQMVIDPDIADYCINNNVAMMGYSPLLAGIYANEKIELPPQYHTAENEVRLKNLKQVASELDISPNTVVLAWMYQSRPAILPVIGVNNVEQLNENLLATDTVLSFEHLDLLNENIYENPVYSQ